MAGSLTSGKLAKELRLFDVFALATGATLSGGLFLLPGFATAQSGPAVVLCYLLAGVPLLPAIMCLVELSTAMPKAGGVYYFLDRALGPLAGTVGGLGTFLALVLKTAFALMGLGAYVALYLEPNPLLTRGIAVGLAVLFGILNIVGAKKSGGFQRILLVGLLIILALFLAQGLPAVHLGSFDGFFAKGPEAIVATAGLVTMSYVGVTKVASVAEEVKDPERNLPRGMFLALFVCLAVYALCTTVLVGVLPMDRLTTTSTPMADAAFAVAGGFGKALLTAAAVMAFFSVANAGILSASRYPLAMARDGLMPPKFAKLDGKGAPVAAILLTVGLVVASVLLLDPLKIAKLASAFLFVMFALLCLSVIVMRESGLESYDPGYRTPLYPWIPFFGVFVPFVFIAQMGLLPTLFSLALVAGCVVWYWTYARHKVDRRGALFHVFARLGEQRHEELDGELRGILKEKGLRDADPFDEVVFNSDVLDLDEIEGFEELIELAATSLAQTTGSDRSRFVEGFREGTQTGATPVAKGVALPHMRLGGISEARMVMVRCRREIRILAGDVFGHSAMSDRVHAVFFLVSPEDDPSQHLRMLAQLASRIDEDDFLEQWLGARNEVQLREVFLRNERYISITVENAGPSARLARRSVASMELPDECLLVAIRREGRTLVPSGRSVLQLGDRLLIIGEPAPIAELYAVYGGMVTE